jgi:hypothetical protein
MLRNSVPDFRVDLPAISAPRYFALHSLPRAAGQPSASMLALFREEHGFSMFFWRSPMLDVQRISVEQALDLW